MEFSTTLRPWMCAGVILLLMASLSCGDSSGPGSTPDVNGSWTLTASYNNAQLQTSCSLNGTVSINQSGQTFTGQVSGSAIQCTTPDGTASGTADGPLTGGQLNGNKVSYSDGECSYSGSITGNPPNRAQGNVNCSVPVAGTSYPFTGSWQLSR